MGSNEATKTQRGTSCLRQNLRWDVNTPPAQGLAKARCAFPSPRFVKNHCPVVEFGLVGKTMHQVDERVEVAQIEQLKSVYRKILEAYFA